MLYLFGYLTLRFQLSTYGVATNLDLFDEKYLFAGCRFLVYLVSSVPNILIIVLAMWVIAYLPWRMVPVSFRQSLKDRLSGWSAAPSHLPLLGVILAVLFIQLVLRRCFAFGNLLVRKQLPDEWLSSLLLASDGKLSLYFSGLVAGTLLTGAILTGVLQRGTATTTPSRIWLGILGFLVAVEFLLLPVNYGILISTQQLPRIVQAGGNETPAPEQLHWLVWDTRDALTYLVRGPNDERMLVSMPRKETQVRIVAYDDIFCVLFAATHAGSRPCPR